MEDIEKNLYKKLHSTHLAQSESEQAVIEGNMQKYMETFYVLYGPALEGYIIKSYIDERLVYLNYAGSSPIIHIKYINKIEELLKQVYPYLSPEIIECSKLECPVDIGLLKKIRIAIQ
jgi:hypothetical protein